MSSEDVPFHRVTLLASHRSHVETAVGACLISRRLKLRAVDQLFLAGLAAVAACEANVERAGRLWGAVDLLDGEVAPALIPADRSRYVTRVRADARFERHYQEGRRLALKDAAAYGLNRVGHPGSDGRTGGPR